MTSTHTKIVLVFEVKLPATQSPYRSLDEAITTAVFVRNKYLAYCQENKQVNKYDCNKYCSVLAVIPDVSGVRKLNFLDRKSGAEKSQASIDSIAWFGENCKKQISGKKGYTRFRKQQSQSAIQDVTNGWKLWEESQQIIGGARDLLCKNSPSKFNSYGGQFSLEKVEKYPSHSIQNQRGGRELGINDCYTTNFNKNCGENPRVLRRDEKAIKSSQRQFYRDRKSLERKHIDDSRRPQDLAVKLAKALRKSSARRQKTEGREQKERNLGQSAFYLFSNDWLFLPSCPSDQMAYENLKIRDRLKNHPLVKSIYDAVWSKLTQWLNDFGRVFKGPDGAAPPHLTSRKSSRCSLVLERDRKAAINILARALELPARTTQGDAESENVCGNPPPYCLHSGGENVKIY